MNGKSWLLALALAAVAAAVLWRGFELNAPAPSMDGHPASLHPRGHKARDASGENLSVTPRDSLYPPRGHGVPSHTAADPPAAQQP